LMDSSNAGKLRADPFARRPEPLQSLEINIDTL
jgi:hypothetical protein